MLCQGARVHFKALAPAGAPLATAERLQFIHVHGPWKRYSVTVSVTVIVTVAMAAYKLCKQQF